MSDDLAATIESGLDAADVDWESVAPREWTAMLAGRNKRTIPVHLHLDDRSLRVRSLLCRSPDEDHADVYRYLLARNERSGQVHFAVDGDSNIVLVGAVPRTALDAESLDRLLGAVLTTMDEVYNAVLRLGFGSYIEAEQSWRASHGMPANPISSPDS